MSTLPLSVRGSRVTYSRLQVEIAPLTRCQIDPSTRDAQKTIPNDLDRHRYALVQEVRLRTC